MSCLEHESSEGGGTDEAETSLDGAGSAGGLGERGGGAVGGAGGRGAERAGHGHGAGGQHDVAGAGGAGAGDVGARGADGLDGGGVGGDLGGGRLNDSRRRVNGVAGRGGGLDGVGSRAGRGGAVAGGSRAGDRGGGGGGAGRGNDGAVGLGDAELGGVLVLAGNVVDQLETVVGDISLEGGGRSPLEGAGVGDALSKSLDGDDVGRGATEEEERDRVGGGWLPGDGEGLAGRDNLGEESVNVSRVCLFGFCAYLDQGTGDGVASGLADGSVELGSSDAGEDSDDGGLGEHLVGIIWY